MTIADELEAREGGHVWVKGWVQVEDGSVYVADVVWMSEARMAAHGDPDPMVVAPGICVEVVSPSSRNTEMARKAQAYIRAGAREVWVVTLDGERTVYKAQARGG